MKKLIKNTLQAAATIVGGFLIFGQSAFALASAVTPTTITSGESVNLKIYCTTAGNTITMLRLIENGVSGSTVIASFTGHPCTASDVTSGFVLSIPITIAGNVQKTLSIRTVENDTTYTDSNTFTVNPAPAPASTKTTLEATGSTVALDGSNPITNNMWLKHSYTIKNVGQAAFSGGSVWLAGGYWFDNSEAQVVDSAGSTCVQDTYGYKCSGFTIPIGGSITISFKTYYQNCDSKLNAGSIYSEELGVLGNAVEMYDGNYDSVNSQNNLGAVHSFDYKYIGCDFTSGATNNPGTSNSTPSNSSAVKVPSTGYSPLVVSLMIITAGAALAGGSVLAYNKLKK